jgi:phosphotriesterase-related protein
LSHDFGIAFNLHLVGGNGYTYLHDSFLPKLKARGVDESTIDQMMTANPRRILALESTGPQVAA